MALASDRLGNDSVWKLVFRLGVPSVVAQLVHLLYNVVDRIYIAQLKEAEALTGLTICFPILITVMAFGAWVGMGGAPYAAIKMGESKKRGTDLEPANWVLGNAFVMLVLVSVSLTVLMQLFKAPILDSFGGNEQSLPYALDYLRIYLWGTLFVQISAGLNLFINAQGFALMSMATVLIGAVLNIVLDPLFIFVFNMGVRGAALATVLSQMVSAVWVMAFFLSKKSVLRLHVRFFRLRKSVCLPILALGVSPFAMQVTEAFVQWVFNSGLERTAASPDEAVVTIAAMGILLTVMQMLSFPMMGMAQGVNPVISYNFGAGKMKRVRETFRALLTVMTGLCFGMYLLTLVFPGLFTALLAPTREVAGEAVRLLPLFMAGTILFPVQFSCQNCFLALGQAKVSLFLALFRKVMLLIPLALLLPLWVVPPKIGIVAAEPIADALAGVVTGWVFARRFRVILRQKEATLGVG